MNNSYRLFLDDVRMPYDVGNYMYPVELRKEYRLREWVIVRSYRQFVDFILENGLPTHISFDHNLADVQPMENSSLVLASDWQNEKTGNDAAKWLCGYLMENNLPMPLCYIHSVNPVGKENIKNTLIFFAKLSAMTNFPTPGK